ncbi:MAG TPA: site-specific integrase [Thermoguttaceae bacterium]|nr:site-specific integrase [Thermoguttaceae bacterium]
METEKQTRSEPHKLPFGKARLAALPAPDEGRAYVYDAKVPGLALCVTSTGTKTFYIYRRIQGRPERIRLGKFPDVTVENARTIARAVVGDIAKGGDPVAERRAARNVPTLREVFDRWGTLHAKVHRRSWPEDVRVFQKYLAPFHGRPMNRITVGDLAEWHGRIGEDHGPVQANRALSLLRTLFNFSPKVGYEGANPCKQVTRFREQSRDRFLTPSEMGAFFEAVEKQPEPWRDVFLVLLFTGARRGDVLSMAWADVDLEGRTWRVPHPKNDQPTILPLVPLALRVLRERHERRSAAPWVFPGRSGHVKDARKAWLKVTEAAGIDNLHIHDLRRSLASWQAALGSSLVIIGASLGHRDLKSTQIYSRLQLDPVRRSVEAATSAMLAAGGMLELEGPKDET